MALIKRHTSTLKTSSSVSLLTHRIYSLVPPLHPSAVNHQHLASLCDQCSSEQTASHTNTLLLWFNLQTLVDISSVLWSVGHIYLIQTVPHLKT